MGAGWARECRANFVFPRRPSMLCILSSPLRLPNQLPPRVAQKSATDSFPAPTPHRPPPSAPPSGITMEAPQEMTGTAQGWPHILQCQPGQCFCGITSRKLLKIIPLLREHADVTGGWGQINIENLEFWGLGGPGRPENLSNRLGVNPSIFLNHFHAARGRPESPNPGFSIFDWPTLLVPTNSARCCTISCHK